MIVRGAGSIDDDGVDGRDVEHFEERLTELRAWLASPERSAVEHAVVLGEELVSDVLFPDRPSAERVEVLDRLAMTYYQRHLGAGSLGDLERSVALCRQAVGDPSGVAATDQRALNNLVNCLLRDFQLTGRETDVVEVLAGAAVGRRDGGRFAVAGRPVVESGCRARLAVRPRGRRSR